MSDIHNTIDDLMLENRKFPPTADFKRHALGGRHRVVRRRRRGLPGFLGTPSRRPPGVVHRMGHHLRMGAAVRQVVRRRSTQRQLQLPRPPCRSWTRRQGGDLSGRASRAIRGCSRTPTSIARLQRFANSLKQLGVQAGIGSTSTCRWSPRRLWRCWPAHASAPCTAWCSAVSALESLSDRINDAEAKVVDHRGRRLSPRRRLPAQARCRRSRRVGGHHRACRGREARRQRRGRCKQGRDHWWHDLISAADPMCPAEPHGQRAVAVHSLHQRHHRATQGHHAHQRRLPRCRSRSLTSTCSTCIPTTTCTGAPPTSAGSPATATSCTARWPTGQPA